MNLITKNKIADYIQQNPETQTPFLSCLKDFDYNLGERFLSNFEKRRDDTAFVIEYQLGLGDYIIIFCINPWLNSAYIIWLGSKSEYYIYKDEELKAKYPNSKFERKQITTSVKITTPDVSELLAKALQKKNVAVNKVTLNESSSVPINLPSENHIPDSETKAEYDKAVEKAIALFYSKPKMPEFDELTSLLLRIKNYEDKYIRLPKLMPLDAIKLKMKTLDMVPENIAHFIGSTENANLFFAGEKQLPYEILEKLYDILCIRYPVRN